MKIYSSYKVKIKNYDKIFNDTVNIYKKAISFFIDICDKEWTNLTKLKSQDRLSLIESLSLTTKNNHNPKYNFDEKFYKIPCYLRRSAINTATGCYSSYYSNLQNWLKQDIKTRGKQPRLQLEQNIMPTLYRDNMFIRTSDNTAKIKIFHNNDWVWLGMVGY